MNLAVLALGWLLLGGRVLPPASIVPAGTKGAAYYEQVGHALASWGQYQPAIRNFEKSLEVEPERLTARLSVARALANLGLGLPALEQVRLVLKADADNLAGNRLHGALLVQAGQLDQAERILREVVRRAPDDGLARKFLGLAYFAKKKLTPAEKELRESIRLRPLDPEPRRLLGQILLAAKRVGAAATALQSYLELRPDDLEVGLILADLYAGLGRHLDALALAVRLADQTPTNPKLMMGIGQTLLKLKRPDQAARYFTRALHLANDPEIVLARCLDNARKHSFFPSSRRKPGSGCFRLNVHKFPANLHPAPAFPPA